MKSWAFWFLFCVMVGCCAGTGPCFLFWNLYLQYLQLNKMILYLYRLLFEFENAFIIHFCTSLFIWYCGELVVCCLSVLYRCSYTILYVTIPCCPYTMSLLQYRIFWGDLHSRFLKNNYFILEKNFRRVQLPSYKFLRFVLRRNHFFLLRMYTFCQVNSSMW